MLRVWPPDPWVQSKTGGRCPPRTHLVNFFTNSFANMIFRMGNVSCMPWYRALCWPWLLVMGLFESWWYSALDNVTFGLVWSCFLTALSYSISFHSTYYFVNNSFAFIDYCFNILYISSIFWNDISKISFFIFLLLADMDICTILLQA